MSATEVTPNMFVFVEEGTANGDTQWVLTTNAPITLGTTALTFSQFGTAPGMGIQTLNTLASTSQTLAVGTTGTDFAISSSSSTHTFNIPDASATARGVITTGVQTITGTKTIQTSAAANKGLVVKGSASQSANLVEVQNSSGTALVSVTSAGVLSSAVATGTAPFTVTSTTQVANLNAATAGNASTVTTNANLTGVVTSTGNATAIADAALSIAKTSGLQAALDASVIPSGMMAPYGGASAPSGWLLCDGTAVSRSTYSTLFTALSTAYGVGDGTTTFNLPDLQRRVPVGRLVGTDSLGSSDGIAAASRLLTHTHTTPAHYHGMGTERI